MSNDFRAQIYNTLKLRETEELVEIWEINDRVGWSELTFDVLQEILQERLGEIPPQNDPVYEYIEEDTDYDNNSDDETPTEYEVTNDFEENSIKIDFEGAYSERILRKKAALIEKLPYRAIIWRSIVFIFLVIILIPLCLYIIQSKAYFSRISLLAFSILCVLYFLYLHPFLAPFFQTKPSMNKIYKGIVSSQGISFTSSGKVKNITWHKIYQAKETEDLIILFAEYILPMTFPRSFFKSEIDWQQFRSWIDYYVPDNKKASNHSISNMLFPLRCPNCANQIDDTVSICSYCGLDLNTPLEETELRILAQPHLEKAKKTIENGGNLKDALSNCNKAIEYIPKSAEAYNLRGLILDSLGKTDESIQAYQEALRLNPNFSEAQKNINDAKTKIQEIRG